MQRYHWTGAISLAFLLAVGSVLAGLGQEPAATAPQFAGPTGAIDQAPYFGSVIDETGRVAVRPRLTGPRLEEGTWFPRGVLCSQEALPPYLTEEAPPELLGQKARDARDLLPAWLRDDFTHNMRYLTVGRQDAYADLILNCARPEFLDELGFQIARIPANYLVNNTTPPRLILENVELLYAIDPLLAYAELVDYGTPGVDEDAYTTVRYRVDENGTVVEYELPPDIYYWYVVHPKTSDETPEYINPETGDTGSLLNGLFWRNYLWSDTAHLPASYTEHFMLRTPTQYGHDRFDQWGPSSFGYLTDVLRAPVPILYSGSRDRPTLLEFAYNRGLVLATVMPLETVYEQGVNAFLERFLAYGNVDTNLRPRSNILVLKNRDPWGIPTVENVLANVGFSQVDVAGIEVLADVNFDLTQYHKIIVPSDQNYSFYETLSSRRGRIESYLRSNRYGVFALLGATSPGQDWAGLIMPGDFTCAPQQTNLIEDITVGGHPLLSDIMSQPTVLWDGLPHNLSGDRYFDFNSHALDLVGNFCTKNMMQNIEERYATNYSYERSVQPVRIAYNHYGNCGELQDLLNAACRTSLIAARPENDPIEDHVWNAFYHEGWHTFEIWWSGSNSRIALPGGAFDTEYGGGKQVPSIWVMRSDYWPLDNTAHYTSTCTLDVQVLDAADNPVDGAYVSVLSDALYGGLGTCIYGYTGSRGNVSFVLGEGRDYYVRVNSLQLGVYDPNPVQVIADSQIDAVYSWSCNLANAGYELPVTALSTPVRTATHDVLTLAFACPYEVIVSRPRNAFENVEFGHIACFIADDANFRRYENDQPFQAHEVRLFDQNGSFTFPFPYRDTWHLVFSNEHSEMMKQVVSFEGFIHLAGAPQPEPVFGREALKLAAGERYVLTFTRPEPPTVALGGYMSTRLSRQDGGLLWMVGYVTHPDGPGAVEEVEIRVGGSPTGLLLGDDAMSGGFEEGDGFYGFRVFIPRGTSATRLPLEIVATAEGGISSGTWPYLNVAP
jgi:hypothetical protein